MILVFGSINVDLVARLATIPGPGKAVLAPSYERHFGHKRANQAAAAARLEGTTTDALSLGQGGAAQASQAIRIGRECEKLRQPLSFSANAEEYLRSHATEKARR